jgi:hypothetical protein
MQAPVLTRRFAVKQGSNKDRTVYSTIDALKEKEANTDSL